MEEYREIPEYPNYMISNFGNLKNKKTDKILNQWIAGRGYNYCRIININGQKKITIHSLVAKIFIGERPINFDIDHIDRNKLNNRVDNLRYLTKSENALNKNIEIKPRKNNNSETHHIIKNKYEKFEVRIKCKYYGSFTNIDDAISKRDEIISQFNI